MEEAAALRPRLNVLLSLANMQLKQGQPAAALLAYQVGVRVRSRVRVRANPNPKLTLTLTPTRPRCVRHAPRRAS